MDTDNPCLQWLPRHKTLVIECKNITHSRRACILHIECKNIAHSRRACILHIEYKNITHTRRACILHLRQVGGATEASRCDIWPIDLGLLRGVCARVAGCNLLSCRPQRIYVPAPEKKINAWRCGGKGAGEWLWSTPSPRHSVTVCQSASPAALTQQRTETTRAHPI